MMMILEFVIIAIIVFVVIVLQMKNKFLQKLMAIIKVL